MGGSIFDRELYYDAFSIVKKEHIFGEEPRFGVIKKVSTPSCICEAEMLKSGKTRGHVMMFSSKCKHLVVDNHYFDTVRVDASLASSSDISVGTYRKVATNTHSIKVYGGAIIDTVNSNSMQCLCELISNEDITLLYNVGSMCVTYKGAKYNNCHGVLDIKGNVFCLNAKMLQKSEGAGNCLGVYVINNQKIKNCISEMFGTKPNDEISILLYDDSIKLFSKAVGVLLDNSIDYAKYEIE